MLHAAILSSALLSLTIADHGFITLDVCDEQALDDARAALQDAIDEAEAALGGDACAFIDETDEDGRNGVARLRRARANFSRALNDCRPHEDPFAVPSFDYSEEELAEFALLEDAMNVRLDVVCMCPPTPLFGDASTFARDAQRCVSFNVQCEGRAEPLGCNPQPNPVAIPVDPTGICDEDHEKTIWAGIFNTFIGPFGYLIADEFCS